MLKEKSSWDKPSWEWQPSLVDPKMVYLRFPGWIFRSKSEHVIVPVRLLDPEGRDALEAFMLPLDFMGFSQRLISLSLVNEKGNRLIPEEDEGELNRETSTLVFALAHAILTVNGMLPPPDQNVDHGKLVSIESIKNTLRKEYPSWPQEKIDGCVEFMSHLRFATPVFSFQRSYKKKYRPGTTARDRLLAALPVVSDEERLAAAGRLLKGKRPIYDKRWYAHERDILNELSTSADLHRKENGEGEMIARTPEDEMTARTLSSIFPAVDKVRKDSGIFTPESEMVKRTKAALNDEVTRDLLGKTWRKQGEDADPEAIAHGLDLAGIPLADEYRTAAGIESVISELDLTRALNTLTKREKRVYEALLQHEGDREATAKALKMTPGNLRGAIHLIKKKIYPPE